jgi:hypothetical protein
MDAISLSVKVNLAQQPIDRLDVVFDVSGAAAMPTPGASADSLTQRIND